MNIAKKGESMSITVVIVAAIALIVLVVLVAVFTGRMGGFNKDVENRGNPDLFKGGVQERGETCNKALATASDTVGTSGTCGITCPDTDEKTGQSYASGATRAAGYAKDASSNDKCVFGLTCCFG